MNDELTKTPKWSFIEAWFIDRFKYAIDHQMIFFITAVYKNKNFAIPKIFRDILTKYTILFVSHK